MKVVLLVALLLLPGCQKYHSKSKDYPKRESHQDYSYSNDNFDLPEKSLDDFGEPVDYDSDDTNLNYYHINHIHFV